ncbi:MAG: phosphatase PAP2 family protein [Ruminococcus flavefaciens]|nr:phosphatase PAP2 family protein [Ruminococcus flavefaciens]MCM1229354.1 phosphatase PAP2 family protein [Ruminococcus flavefaciens]
MDVIREIDFLVLDYIREHMRSGFLDNIMPVITAFGNLGIFWVAVALIISAKAKYRKCSITMMIGMILGVVIGNFAVKNIIRRDRPCWINEIGNMLIDNPQDFSFPSGHTMSSFIAATILCYYDKKLGIPSFGIAILIAFSRLYLYVHFPTDIIGGALLGVGIAVMTISATNRYIFSKTTPAQ